MKKNNSLDLMITRSTKVKDKVITGEVVGIEMGKEGGIVVGMRVSRVVMMTGIAIVTVIEGIAIVTATIEETGEIAAEEVVIDAV